VSEDGPVLKPVDAWWTVVLIDPVAVRLARALVPVGRVRPSHLTVVAHLLGLVSAVLLAGGHLLPAAVAFEVRFVLDCADGKLARLRGTSSAAGAYLDYVGDYLVTGSAMVGLGIWLVEVDAGPAAIALALPAAFLASIAAGQAANREVAAAGAALPLTADAMPGGYRRWMAARRLKPLPSRIEAEHGLLFVAPVAAVVLGDDRWLARAAAVGVAYFGYEALHLARSGWKVAVGADRARPAGGPPPPG